MNIIEAIKSHKPFRRTIDPYGTDVTFTKKGRFIYLTLLTKEFRYIGDRYPLDDVMITGHDILADDWEVDQ